MDRTIEVKVNGSYITKDNRNAGVQHEANSTSLRIEFDPGWDSYAKKITWWNAKGEDPVEITLGTNLLEDAAASTRIYLCPIPMEPLAECGECTFVIDGYVDGKRQRSAADQLWVKEAPFKENAGQPSDPTPSQAEQLQKEIDGIKGTISQAVASRDAAAESAAQAKTSETAAASSAGAAAKSEAAADESAASAAADASAAAKSAGAAAQSEQTAKASETAAKSSATTASSAAATAAQAKTAAESAQAKTDKAQAAAERAKEAAEAAQGKAESAQTAAEAAKTAAKSSETAAAASEKTAKSWAVGGTGTRVGEDTNNAKYWSDRASAIAGGDFATKAEARGYVDAHNQSSAAHADLRQAIESKEDAGAAAAVQQELDTHTGNAAIHITAEERAKWNAKEEGGAAAAVQQNLTAHMEDTVKHVTAEERTAWNGKADLVDGKVPSSQLPAADGFTKEETLKAATAALYGLGTGAVPDDVLAELGKYTQYWWRRRVHTRTWEITTTPTGNNITVSANATVQYSSDIAVDFDGNLSLINPKTSIGASYDNRDSFNAAIKDYWQYGAWSDRSNFWKGGNPVSNWYGNSANSFTNLLQVVANMTDENIGDWEFVTSRNRNQYPDTGNEDGYDYEYLGIPFDNAVTAPKIETGSYVGTGTYGANNPNTLTFGFKPKMVFMTDGRDNFDERYTMFFPWIESLKTINIFKVSQNDYQLNTTISGNTISWFTTSNASFQWNEANRKYCYLAIG